MLPCSIPKRVSHIPGKENQYYCNHTTLFQTETCKDWHQPTTISWEFKRMLSINNLYIENIPFRWICMWYRHVCTEQKYVHTRNVYITLITQTHGPTHLGISYIKATHRKLCLIHVPQLQAYYVCVCDFGHFICFFFRIRCMYWKHTLFLCLFFWLSQLLHQLCHWAPKSDVVDDRSCK